MILTRQQADAAINMGIFLESNLGLDIYSTVMRALESPPGPSTKTVTFTRTTVSGQPIGQMTVLVKRPLNPDENYANLDLFITAYNLVT